MNTYLQKLCELVPLVLFFAFYKAFDIFAATAVMVFTSIISLLLILWIEKRISRILLFSAVISITSGVITLYSKDTTYIKMKPTVLYIIFALSLLAGKTLGKNFLQMALGHAFEMPNNKWWQLTYSFALFFISLAILNEFIWRNFSEEVWVNFKVFGIIPLNICFVIVQFYRLKSYLKLNN
jgi:intracellular septation protein